MILVQPWIDSLFAKVTHSKTLPDILTPVLKEWKASGFDGVAWHGNSLSLPPVFERLATLAQSEGLVSYASFGMNSDDMLNKGKRIRACGNHPLCKGVSFNPESKLEDEAPPVEKAHAREFVKGFVGSVPFGKPAFLNSWFAPHVHKGMPWEELASVSTHWCPEVYYNDFRSQFGTSRFRRVNKIWDKGEAYIAERLGKAGFHLLPGIGIQGYEYQDIPKSLDKIVRLPRDPMLVWCEFRPTPQVLAAVKAMKGL